MPFSVCLLLAMALVAYAQNIDLKVEANRNQIYLGESFILQITVLGVRHPPEPDLSAIKNGRIRPLGSRDISNYSITIINGRVMKEGYIGRTLSYEITPLASGLFQAGPVTVDIKGQKISAPGPVVRVTDIERQDMVKLAIAASRETVLVDEPFDIKLTALIRRLKGKYAGIEPLFPDNPPNVDVSYLEGKEIQGLSGPDIRQILQDHLVARMSQPGICINNRTLASDPFDFSGGFNIQGFFSKPRRAKFALNPQVVEWNGKSYVEYSLSLTFCPQEEGNYVFGPAVFKGAIPAEVDDSGQASSIRIFAVGPACTVRVIPPPEKGRPLSYSGAIGTNLIMNASLDTKTCNVGDPLQLTLNLSGQIRFNNMLPPKLSLQTNLLEHFTIYDNTVETIKKDNSRQYIYTLRPNQAGSYDLPAIKISYYDIRDRVYNTVETSPIPLHIRKGSEITASEIIGRTNGLEDQPKEPDAAEALPAPIRTYSAGAEPGTVVGDPVLIAVAGTGPVLFTLVLMGQFIQRHNSAWKTASKRQRARAQACTRLRATQSAGRSNQERVRAEICAALRQYLADRFQDSSVALTPADARTKLADCGVNSEVTEAFCSIFEQVFNEGFSKQSQDHNLVDISKKVRRLIADIENDLRRQPILRTGKT